MDAFDLLTNLGVGVVAELIVYLVARRVLRFQSKASAMIVALLALLVYVPYGLLNWPGVDVFAIHLAIYLTLAYGLGLVGGRAGKGWHPAPAIIVGFFVFVVAINIVFVTVSQEGIGTTGIFSQILPKPRNADVAVSRFPGVVSHDYQEKEALYNAYLREVETQQARGWQVSYGWLGDEVRVQEPARLMVLVRDRAGEPLRDAKVAGRFMRHADVRDDFEFVMTEINPGDYQLSMAMPKPGLWGMVLTVQRGDDKHEVRAETSVKPALE